jgi:[ribosomal protein S18]-alanine N-acetyltransferase
MIWPAWLRRAPEVARVAPLQARHTAHLADIHASAFARPWTADDFEQFLTDRSVRADGLFLGRAAQPSGFIISRRAADEAEILSVAVRREVRGRGHGLALVAAHLQGLAHAGIRTVHLEVEDGNDPALALYRRLGFTPAGRREGYYLRSDGSRVGALTMSRAL